MMEQPQYEKWLTGCFGYWAQPLKAYAESDVWKSDPKIAAYRDTCANEFWNGYKGPITAASGAVNGRLRQRADVRRRRLRPGGTARTR